MISTPQFLFSTVAPNGSAAVGLVIFLIMLAVFFIMYFVPTAVAQYRKSENITTVVLLNIFLGWTVIGWIVALILAFAGDSGNQRQRHYEMMQELKKRSE